jgi:predicted esterase
MVDLRCQPAFARAVLLAPALRDEDYEWGRAATVRALDALLSRVLAERPVARGQVYLLGYSAGASRVLAVARGLRTRLAGIVAVAGDVARPVRDDLAALSPLREVPVLLVCMTEDDGPHTRCGLNEANQVLLRGHGVRDVTLARIPGTHALDAARVATVVAAWQTRLRQ